MRTVVCAFALVGTVMAFGASDVPRALSARQIEKLIADLEDVKAQIGVEQTANVDAAISFLRQARREGVDIGNARTPVAEYFAFRNSPVYGFLDAKERRLLGKLVEMASRRPQGDICEGNDLELESLGDSLGITLNPMDLQPWHNKPPCQLKCGDLVLRREGAFLSHHFVEGSSREKRFSHVGIVAEVGDAASVVTVGDRGFSMGSVCVVKWQEFMRKAVDCAIYRFEGGEEIGNRILRAARKRLGLPFDSAFDIKTKDRLYCSELVHDVVNEAVGRTVVGTTRKGAFEYVAIDDCYHSGWIKIFDANNVGGSLSCLESSSHRSHKPQTKMVAADERSTK